MALSFKAAWFYSCPEFGGGEAMNMRIAIRIILDQIIFWRYEKVEVRVLVRNHTQPQKVNVKTCLEKPL